MLALWKNAKLCIPLPTFIYVTNFDFDSILLFPFCLCQAIEILEYNPTLSTVGINKCNMKKNGELLIAHEYINPNSIVFDIGANEGLYSQEIFHIDPSVSIFAFEPLLFPYNTLKSLSFVKSFNFGFSDKEESQDIYFYPCDTTNSSLYIRPTLQTIPTFKNKVLQKTTVHLFTIDMFCEKNNIQSVDFIKIDTEGHEFKVLLGAEKMLLNKKIKYIQFEYGGSFIDSKNNSETNLRASYKVFLPSL